ncbi:MAG: hypothetical protein KDB61_05440 [Planctomycetes bacterium]|nr:hypothetical protein [Planctomycetota bacterium]
MKLAAIWLASALAGSAWGQDGAGNRFHPVELDLLGPLQSVTVDCGRVGDTRIELELGAGEQRNVRVPLPKAAGSVDWSRDLRWQGAGRVSAPRNLPMDPVPTGTPSGPLPLVPETVPVLPMASFLGLLALGLILVFQRRRPWLSIPISLAGGCLLFLQVGTTPAPSPGCVRLIDMGEGQRWRVVDSARHALAHKPGQAIELRVQPASAALHWIVGEDSGSLKIEAQSQGSLLRKLYSVPAGMRHLELDLNALCHLDRVWLRGESGVWSALGAWELGQPIPAAIRENEGPPAWLADGLPMGPRILVGRCAPDVQGSLGLWQEAQETWIRWRIDP